MSAALTNQRERIARLNDLARRAMGVACTAVATVGFRSLPDADQSCVRELIETFDAFDEDNDPHGERDFGTIYQLADGRWTTERPRLREDERERAKPGRDRNLEMWGQVIRQDFPFVIGTQATVEARDRAGIRTRFSPYWEEPVLRFQRMVLDAIDAPSASLNA